MTGLPAFVLVLLLVAGFMYFFIPLVRRAIQYLLGRKYLGKSWYRWVYLFLIFLISAAVSIGLLMFIVYTAIQSDTFIFGRD
jgi:hypothetical protein